MECCRGCECHLMLVAIEVGRVYVFSVRGQVGRVHRCAVLIVRWNLREVRPCAAMFVT